MHDTALDFGRRFFQAYAGDARNRVIVDIGAQDITGSLRSVAPAGNEYVGVDFVAGKGVDVVITDPYKLPFDNESVDICVCSSCFEHAEFFWLVYLEILRILKPSGLFYLNVPSNGPIHRYPVDCWRFYPDSGVALANWGRRNGYRSTLLESFVGKQESDVWNDFVAIFLKDESHLGNYPRRMQDAISSFSNGLKNGSPQFSNFTERPEDQKFNVLRSIRREIIFMRNKWGPGIKRAFGKA